jgi:hypothetical protein
MVRRMMAAESIKQPSINKPGDGLAVAGQTGPWLESLQHRQESG